MYLWRETLQWEIYLLNGGKNAEGKKKITVYLNRKDDYCGQLVKFLVSLLETTIYKAMKTNVKD